MIEIAAGLDRGTRRRAIADGPPHAATSSTYPSLFGSAGYTDVEAIDLTEAYRATAARWLAERERRVDALAAALGPDAAADRIAQGKIAVRAIDAGLLRRTLYLARRD